MKSAVEHYLFTGKEFEGKTVLVITHDTREESLSQYDGIIHVGENGIYVELKCLLHLIFTRNSLRLNCIG